MQITELGYKKKNKSCPTVLHIYAIDQNCKSRNDYVIREKIKNLVEL